MNSAGLGPKLKAANRVTLARQFRDTGNRRDAAGSGRQFVVELSRKGKLCPLLHHLSIRQLGASGVKLNLKRANRQLTE
jgi:hypothetical protein